MRKDNFGICFSFYAVLGFVFALLGHTTLALLLLGFVIVVQKDQWLTMQVMQAFFLSIVSGIVSAVLGIFDVLYKIPALGKLVSLLFSAATSVVSLVVLLLAIVGIARTAKEKDADIPLIKDIAQKAFGLVKNGTGTQA